MRTQDEIKTEFKKLNEVDMFGWKRMILTDFMIIETVKELNLLKDDITDEELKEFIYTEPTDENIIAKIKDYMDFALGKALNHRGISASRSIEKFTEWLWLLNRPDITEKFEEAKYENYGVPQLKVICSSLHYITVG